MFDTRESLGAGPAATVSRCRAVVQALDTDCGDAEAIDAIRELEDLKAAAAAAQARLTAMLADRATIAAEVTYADRSASVRREQVAAARRSVAAQVALARRDSPAKGSRHLGLACALLDEMPRTLAALRSGELSEWRATLVARETTCLSVEDRRRVDATLAGRLAGLGDRAVATAARREAYRLDPASVVRRAAGAAADRCVTVRPAPDTMAYLTAYLPAAQAVGCYAALCAAADTARSEGEPKGRGQVMADTLVERVTGRNPAVGPDVEVSLVMTDQTVFGCSHEPARLDGYGVIPAGIARSLLCGTDTPGTEACPAGHHTSGGRGAGAASDPTNGARCGVGATQRATVWLRRVFTDRTGSPTRIDPRRRLFPPDLRRLLVLRDETCRTPWCDAPIRHLDHVQPYAVGGPTSLGNGQGLCEACNHTKEHPGWATHPQTDGDILVTTPAGHTYTSRPPPLPGRI